VLNQPLRFEQRMHELRSIYLSPYYLIALRIKHRQTTC
jgi:hypothetical protein